MALTPKIEIKQSQSLLMTPQLRQAINLLQMSNLELNELVEKELAGNPLLEREDDRLNDNQPEERTIDDYEASATPEEPDFSPDTDYDNNFDDDFASDREGYETPSDYNWDNYNRTRTADPDTDFDFFEQKLSAKPSLYQLLNEQITINFSQPRERLIAALLCEFLDPAGYFRGNTDEIAQRLKTSPEEIRNILSRLQTFEPSGIFAASLKDCLTIQLRDRNRLDPLMEKFLNHLELVGERNFKELKKRCDLTDEDLSSLLEDIRSLNPKPAADYDANLTAYIIPDVFVKTDKHGNYRIELNNMSLPRVLINKEYYSELHGLSQNNKQAKRYLREQLGSAGFLVHALHQRATTILRVSEEIVKSQRNFFEYGIDHLKPMALKDVAEKLEMHESTVSRVTSRKYISTPRGTFELKYFFSAAAGSYTGEENTSTLSIKHQIKKLIDDETPDKILSDDKIVELLATRGIKIARRTVTKYREAMNIPASGQRKRTKRSAF